MTPEVASLRRRKKNMAKKILLSKTFALPARAVTESIAIMGRKGSGKTYTGGRLFEQMHGIGAQCVALDPVGNWWGLRSSATGKSLGLDIPIFGGEHGDIPITPGSGKIMAEVIVNRRISCVIDLKLFRANQRKEFVTDFAEELYHLARDPQEMQNLASDPAHAERVAALRARLRRHMEETNDPYLDRPFLRAFDPAVYEPVEPGRAYW